MLPAMMTTGGADVGGGDGDGGGNRSKAAPRLVAAPDMSAEKFLCLGGCEARVWYYECFYNLLFHFH